MNNFLDEEYPRKLRSKFPSIINVAFEATNQFMEFDEILRWEVGRELKPYFRRIAVEHQFVKMIKNNRLDLTYQIKQNVGKNCSHVEIYNKNSILTINHVQYKHQLAPDARFRSNIALRTQLSLFQESEEETVEDDKYYLQLIYGGDELPDFIILGIPDPTLKKWIDSRSLLEEIYVTQMNLKEEFEKESIVELKEFLKDKKDNLKNGNF